MKQIDDLTFIKILGKGAFGEVFLTTKRGRREYFATKKLDRSQIDNTSLQKYFVNEIGILKSLNHPNIVRIEDLKTTSNNYFLVMEYVNGGSLTDCLEKYKNIYGQAFPEGVVQNLMRQIVDAIKYIHSRKIIHRDLKLDNIMVNFDTENDKNDLNMMRARIKIIDFGFAIRLDNKLQTFSVVGSPINMDPIILKRFGGDINQLGYDSKADIWSLGTICYELLIGKRCFNADTLNDLINKIESGNYNVPTSLSQEVVSFLNGMLQYEGADRLNIEELSRHPFLTKKVGEFHQINLNKVSRNLTRNGLQINTRENKTIWAIFNEDDEKKLININGRNNTSNFGSSEGENNFYRRTNTMPKMNSNQFQLNNSMGNYQQPNINPYQNRNYNNNQYQLNNNSTGNNYHRSNTNNYQNMNFNNYPSQFNNKGNYQQSNANQSNLFNNGKSFYGQSMNPNNSGGISQGPFNRNVGVMPQMNRMPQMGINTNNPNNSSNFSFGVPKSYSFSGGIYQKSQSNNTNYQTNPIQNNQNNINQYPPYNNVYESKKESSCLII